MEQQDRLIDIQLLLQLIRNYRRIIIASCVLVLILGSFLTYRTLDKVSYERVREVQLQPLWIDSSSQTAAENVPSDVSAAVSGVLSEVWSDSSLDALTNGIDAGNMDLSVLITSDPANFRFIGKATGSAERQAESALDDLMILLVTRTEHALQEWSQDTKDAAVATENELEQELRDLYEEIDEHAIGIPLEKRNDLLRQREILIEMIAGYQRDLLEDSKRLTDQQYAAMNTAGALLGTLDSYMQGLDEKKVLERTRTFLVSNELVLESEDISNAATDSFDEKELVKNLLRSLFGYLILMLFLLTLVESRKQLAGKDRE